MRKWINDLIDRVDLFLAIFGGRTIFMLILSIVLAMLMIVVNDTLLMTTRDKTDTMAVLESMIDKAQRMRNHLLAAESAQRGYLLTQSTSLLNDYEHSVSEYYMMADQLETITDNLKNDSMFTKLSKDETELLSNADKKISEMNVTINLAKNKQLSNAINVVKLNNGFNEMNMFSNQLSIFEQNIATLHNDYLKERNNFRRITRLIILICPIFFIILVSIVIKQMLQELKEKHMLQAKLEDENNTHQRNSVELTKRLHTIGLQNLSNIEREREKLARELHDELGSLLTAIKMDISWSIKQLKDTHPQIIEKLAKTKEYVDRGIFLKRDIVQNLHPSMIDAFGLINSIRTLIDDSASRNQWETSVILPSEDFKPDETIGLILYRVIQESLNNCAKYAKASKVTINVIADETTIKVEVDDNGVGFDVETQRNKSHGLNGMQSRIESIGGHMTINSTPNKGTSIQALLPM